MLPSLPGPLERTDCSRTAGVGDQQFQFSVISGCFCYILVLLTASRAVGTSDWSELGILMGPADQMLQKPTSGTTFLRVERLSEEPENRRHTLAVARQLKEGWRVSTYWLMSTPESSATQSSTEYVVTHHRWSSISSSSSSSPVPAGTHPRSDLAGGQRNRWLRTQTICCHKECKNIETLAGSHGDDS